MRATGNIKLAQRLLGHEDIATTARYAHVTGDDLLAAMNATHSATDVGWQIIEFKKEIVEGLAVPKPDTLPDCAPLRQQCRLEIHA